MGTMLNRFHLMYLAVRCEGCDVRGAETITLIDKWVLDNCEEISSIPIIYRQQVV